MKQPLTASTVLGEQPNEPEQVGDIDREKEHTEPVNRTEHDYEPSAGAVYGAMGVVLTSLGALALANANESGVFGVVGVAIMAGGAYAIIVGAVARGVQLARINTASARPHMPRSARSRQRG